MQIKYSAFLVKLWVFLNFTQYLFTKTFPILPDWFVWFDEVVLFVLLIDAFINRMFYGKPVLHFSIMRFVIVFVTIGVFSSIINGTVFSLSLVLGFRFFIQSLLIYFVIVSRGYSLGLLKNIINLLVLIILLQVPVIFFQALTYPVFNFSDARFEDSQYGFFGYGAANLLGILLLFPTLLNIFRYRLKLIPRIALFGAFIILLAQILTFSKVSYIFLIIGIYIVYNVDIKKNVIRLFSFRSSIIVTSIIFLVMYFVTGSTNTNNDIYSNISGLTSRSGIEANIENQLQEDGSGRFFMFAAINTEMQESNTTLIFGYGPGNYCSNAGFITEPPRLKKWLDVFGERSTRFDMDILALISEYGYLGFISYILIYIFAIIKLLKLKNLDRDSYFFSVKVAFFVWGILYLIGAATNAVFQTPWMSGAFWLLLATLVSADQKLRDLVSFVENGKSN